MSDVTIIYLAETDPSMLPQWEAAARRSGCRLQVGTGEGDGIVEACGLLPDVFVMRASGSVEAESRFCRRFKCEPRLKSTFLLLLRDSAAAEEEWPDAGPDDVLLRSASVYEITARVQSGLRVARLRREVAAYRTELERCASLEDADDELQATAQLVEIAAELQAEVCHSAEREEAHVRDAQADTIAQAATALRHEINNPLCAIMGSAESAGKRLHTLRDTGRLDPQDAAQLEAALKGMERIQRGSERIQQVVQSISDMLTPATTDYVSGVSMLDIHKKDREDKQDK